ncbi:MarR family transcriptional regulator [soil metagenome]
MATDIEELGRAVKHVQARNHWALDTALGSVGTTLAQWDALRAIGRNPAASAHHLAQETFQSDQAFGTLAGRLVRQGLIERRAGAGRRIEHRLTEAGQRMLDAGRPIAREVGADTFANLDENERATLLALLRKAAGTP